MKYKWDITTSCGNQLIGHELLILQLVANNNNVFADDVQRMENAGFCFILVYAH